jgi:hypothetical protein
MTVEADLLTGDEHCEADKADKQQGESDQEDE